MADLIENIMTELKQRRDWNNPEEVEIWFEEKLREVKARAVAEERERVVGEIGKKLEKINDYPLHNEFVKGETEAYKNVLASLDKPLTEKESE